MTATLTRRNLFRAFRPGDNASAPQARVAEIGAACVEPRGVTCRRWNWRQGTRTRLIESSTDALFLLERLAPYSLEDLDAAGDALEALLRQHGPASSITRRRLGPRA